MINPEPEHMTVAEVTAVYPISRTKLYDVLAAGRVQAVKLGRKTLIVTSSLTEFMGALPPFRSGR